MSKSILVYSSIGDISTFFPLWKHEDICYAFNYYGQCEDRKKRIEGECSWFTCEAGTKFNLFSKLYEAAIPIFDYYVLIDDDINLRGSDIVKIVLTMESQRCGVASPSHSPEGRISWDVMVPRKNSTIRVSDFVEMTVAIFSREELENFLKAYVPYRDRMVGWGIDHIIHSVCRKPFLIFDDVVITNPSNKQKGINKREIETYLDGRSGERLWKAILADSENSFIEYTR